jgi:hypothetical protein
VAVAWGDYVTEPLSEAQVEEIARRAADEAVASLISRLLGGLEGEEWAELRSVLAPLLVEFGIAPGTHSEWRSAP